MPERRMTLRKALAGNAVIPAHPLALTAERKLDERRQRALSRYYVAAGATGLAAGVHSTQFAIRDPKVGLFEPVIGLAAEEMNRAEAQGLPLSDPAASIASAPSLAHGEGRGQGDESGNEAVRGSLFREEVRGENPPPIVTVANSEPRPASIPR